MYPEIDTSYYFTFFVIFIKLLKKFGSFCQLLQILCMQKKAIVSLTYDHLSHLFWVKLIYHPRCSSELPW